MTALQADALTIEAGAKRRLADEYDAARDGGVVSARGQRTDLLPDEKKVPTVAELGLTHKGIHEGRLIRDAEAADPGIEIRRQQIAHDRRALREWQQALNQADRFWAEHPDWSFGQCLDAILGRTGKLAVTPEVLS